MLVLGESLELSSLRSLEFTRSMSRSPGGGPVPSRARKAVELLL